MVHMMFSPFSLSYGSRLLNLSFIALRYRSQFSHFKLRLVLWGIELIVKCIYKLMRIGRWSEPRLVFVCQLVEVIREADANETCGDDGLVFLGSIVDESQLGIPNLEPKIMFCNGVPLLSFELEYHAE